MNGSLPSCTTQTHHLNHSPVGMAVSQVQRVTRVLAQNEREDGILHEVVEGAAGHLVEGHEVLEVSDPSVEPVLLDRGQVLSLYHVGQS